MTHDETVKHLQKHLRTLNTEKLIITKKEENYSNTKYLTYLKVQARKHLTAAYLTSIHVEALERELTINVNAKKKRK